MPIVYYIGTIVLDSIVRVTLAGPQATAGQADLLRHDPHPARGGGLPGETGLSIFILMSPWLPLTEIPLHLSCSRCVAGAHVSYRVGDSDLLHDEEVKANVQA